MNWSLLLTALAFAFVMAVTPGPNNTFMLNSAVNFGLRKTMPYLYGILAGLCGLLIAIGSGLGAIFIAVPTVYQALKWIGFAYIIWLAIQLAISSKHSESGQAKQIGFWKSTAFQFVNVKAWIAVASYMAAYVPVSLGFWPSVITSSMFLVGTFPGALIWAASGEALRNWLQNPRRMRAFNIASAIVLVVSMLPVLFH